MEGLKGGGGGETRGLIMHLGVQHRGLQNTSCLSVCLSLPEENTVALKALVLTRLERLRYTAQGTVLYMSCLPPEVDINPEILYLFKRVFRCHYLGSSMVLDLYLAGSQV